MYRLIVSDLDGTLLDKHYQLSSKTISLVNQLYECGIQFLIATGRHYRDAQQIAAQFNFPMYLVTSNGARVHDNHGHLLLQEDVLPKDVDQILRLTESWPFHRNLYHDDCCFIETGKDPMPEYAEVSGFNHTPADFSTVTRDGISKVLFIGDPVELKSAAIILSEQYGQRLNITFSLTNCLEVMNGKANKGIALSAILEKLHLTPQQTIAFGDGLNDVEMLFLAGKGVIMGNADQRLCARLPAHPRSASNDEEGVASYLRQEFYAFLKMASKVSCSR